MFGWCSRAGTFVKLPAPDGLVCVLLQVVSRGSTWSKSGPHHSTVLHGIRRARIKHCLILEPTVFRLHPRSCIRHGDHPALPISIAIIEKNSSLVSSLIKCKL